jgi:glycosyltransferase involved in cell wall biosynthesis
VNRSRGGGFERISGDMGRGSHSNPTRFHVWAPGLSGAKGGIQVFSAFFLDALSSLRPSASYEVLIKHDSRGVEETDGGPRIHTSGAWPMSVRTPAFAAALLGRGLLRRPDLVITTHLNFSAAARWLKRLAGVPYWVVAHGIEAWDVRKPHLRTALREADLILAVSSYTRERLLAEQSLDPARVVVLPNTVSPGSFRIGPKPDYLLARYGLGPEQPVILTVSRLFQSEQYKGYDKILEAMPRIIERLPAVRYIIAGDGDDRGRIERLIAEKGLGGRVTLAGFVPDAELCDHYNLCDVFAMPSKREGFGIVYLEAMACGKPTLAGNKDGAVDALQEGKLGALVNPDDTREITDTLVDILESTYPNDLMYRPEALREAVVDAFGFDSFKHTLSTYLEEFFASADGRPAAGLKGGKAA